MDNVLREQYSAEGWPGEHSADHRYNLIPSSVPPVTRRVSRTQKGWEPLLQRDDGLLPSQLELVGTEEIPIALPAVPVNVEITNVILIWGIWAATQADLPLCGLSSTVVSRWPISCPVAQGSKDVSPERAPGRNPATGVTECHFCYRGWSIFKERELDSTSCGRWVKGRADTFKTTIPFCIFCLFTPMSRHQCLYWYGLLASNLPADPWFLAFLPLRFAIVQPACPITVLFICLYHLSLPLQWLISDSSVYVQVHEYILWHFRPSKLSTGEQLRGGERRQQSHTRFRNYPEAPDTTDMGPGPVASDQQKCIGVHLLVRSATRGHVQALPTNWPPSQA